MILEKIQSPLDLKNLNNQELETLCEELRRLIIKVVSTKGGHLASSLGAVELTCALHYCFSSPEDKIIWDVGHQCYAHKILTGRKDIFSRMRTLGGISGFPSPQESEHDPFFVGHASTALSLAMGLCCSRDMENKKYHVVSVVGDGSLTGGMSFEAMNNIGHLKKDMLIVLNSNEMSISKTVGAISAYLNRIITDPLYNKFRMELEHLITHLPGPAQKLTSLFKRFEEGVKNILVPGILFEELGIRYFGPLDGHNLKNLISTIKNIKDLPGPKILHVITRKGKGYSFAEKHPEHFHSAPAFNTATGAPLKAAEETYTSVFSKKLVEIASGDDRIIAITAAMPQGTGLNVFAEKFPGRFYDVGIAEAHAVTFSSALSKSGFRPVVAVYSTFLQRCYDQLVHDVALQGTHPVFILDRSGLVGADGPTHQGIFDIAFLRTIPEFVIMAPKDKEELQDMLEFAVYLDKPSSIRFPKDKAASFKKRERIILGMPQVIKEGNDVCFLCIGTILKQVMEAVSLLEKESIRPTVINSRFIKPLNEDFLADVIRKHRLVITVEEGIETGGFGSGVLELCQRNDIPVGRIKILGVPPGFITFGAREDLFRLCGLDPESIFKRTMSFVKETNPVQSK